jgi:hypothetical protein
MKSHTNPDNNQDLLLFITKTFGISLVACLAICLYDLKTIDRQLDSLTALASNLEDAPGTEPSPDPEPTEPTEPTPSFPTSSVATPAHLVDCIYPLAERLLLPAERNKTKVCVQNISLDIVAHSTREVSLGSTAKLSFTIRNLAKDQKISGHIAVVLTLVDTSQKPISTLSFPTNFSPSSKSLRGPEERLVFQALNYSPKVLTFASHPRWNAHIVQADFYIQLAGDPEFLVFHIDKIPINTIQYHGDAIN